MKIAFIGDIVGKPGRSMLQNYLKKIRSEFALDMVIANGENASHGFGLSIEHAKELLLCGVDMISGGNHSWDKKEIIPLLDSMPILRPLNYPESVEGSGVKILHVKGEDVAVVNILGHYGMPMVENPFLVAKKAVEDLHVKGIKTIIVDFHAEATSEKRALAFWLDGKVSVVVGTHTHVQTADEEVLPSGTAFISDVGMTGGHGGIIGMTYDSVIPKFLYGTPSRFEVCDKNVRFQAVVVDIDSETGRGMDIRRVNIPCD